MKYLITGVVAAGKSTVASKLTQKGFTVFEGDDTPGLARWEDKSGLPLPKVPKVKAGDWYSRHDWNWNKQKLEELLGSDETVFICGVSSNQSKFYDLFDKIFLLQIGENSLLERLKNRHQNSVQLHYEERLGVLGWHQPFEQDTLRHGAIAISATSPSDQVVDEVLKHVNDH